MRLAKLRTLEGISHVRATGRHLNVEIVKKDIADASNRSLQVSVPEADKERVAGVFGDHISDIDILDGCAVNRFYGDDRSEGVADGAVANGDVFKSAMAAGAEFDGAGAADDVAVRNRNVFASGICPVGLQADAVITAVEVAEKDFDFLAVEDIDTVVVPIGAAFDFDFVDEEVFAISVCLHPTA